MSHRSVLILLAGTGGICALVLWLLVAEDPPPTGSSAVGNTVAQQKERPSARGATPADAKVASASAPSRAGRQRRRLELDRRREAIRERLARRAVDPAGRAADSEPEAVLDKEYIRETVSEGLVPALHDCYDSELEEDPTLEGKVVIRFEILGDEEVGGVVDNVQVVEDQTTLRNETLHECMQESMYALDFPAPDRGGTVTVTYPFMFQPE